MGTPGRGEEGLAGRAQLGGRYVKEVMIERDNTYFPLPTKCVMLDESLSAWISLFARWGLH